LREKRSACVHCAPDWKTRIGEDVTSRILDRVQGATKKNTSETIVRQGYAEIVPSVNRIAVNPHITHLGEQIETFEDTAAIISSLDLVISSDTSVVHLAGALGKPVWILLQYVPDWRWLFDRDDSPWYPTARLFRQSETRKWDDVIEQAHEALLKFVESRPCPAP
jgi:hypothetical protein